MAITHIKHVKHGKQNRRSIRTSSQQKMQQAEIRLVASFKTDSRERGNGYAKPVRDYSIEIDSVGQTSAQEPHSVQAEASIT